MGMSIQELRMKKLKESWMKIQAEKELLDKDKKKWQYYKKMVRSLSQTVPKRQECINKMLDEFNKVMI